MKKLIYIVLSTILFVFTLFLLFALITKGGLSQTKNLSFTPKEYSFEFINENMIFWEEDTINSFFKTNFHVDNKTIDNIYNTPNGYVLISITGDLSNDNNYYIYKILIDNITFENGQNYFHDWSNKKTDKYFDYCLPPNSKDEITICILMTEEEYNNINNKDLFFTDELVIIFKGHELKDY